MLCDETCSCPCGSIPPKPSARRQPSAEILTPGYNHPSRRSDISVAVFNILATIVGAGVLSLPYAMSKTGWVLGLIMLGLSAAASDFTLYILCSSSRRSGVPSFTLLARHCFGTPMPAAAEGGEGRGWDCGCLDERFDAHASA